MASAAVLLGCRAGVSAHLDDAKDCNYHAPTQSARFDTANAESGVGRSDRREDIFPTPQQATERSLAILHGVLAEYRNEHQGQLPSRLEELLPLNAFRPMTEVPDNWLHDGWHQPLRYRVSSTGYLLRSDGADGRTGTADDIVLCP